MTAKPVRFRPSLYEQVTANVSALTGGQGADALPPDLQASLAKMGVRAPVRRKPRQESSQTPSRKAKRGPESRVNLKIREWAHTRHDVRLWRNSRGMVDLANGGKMAFGVGPNGGSDWIGYRVVRITSDMVGRDIAMFCAVEAKAPGGHVADNQTEFCRVVTEEGGHAGIAESAEDARNIVDHGDPIPF